MKQLQLSNLKLKTFTEQDILDYCQINNINPDKITILYLDDNQLTDISGVKLFKNLTELYLWNNRLKNISVLRNLINLKNLWLNDNKLTDISLLSNLKNLKELYLGNNQIIDISVIQYFTELKELNIKNLLLESYQFQYIKSLKNLKELWCKNGFKDMSIVKHKGKIFK